LSEDPYLYKFIRLYNDNAKLIQHESFWLIHFNMYFEI